ncbi:response regulator [Larkinella soli]|uniref:response regulator n=1 Tax=Larkinella soli TaxID=1770527 RepID=UPI000FFB3815|nr:response regulator [Larkinella soli]
MSIKGPIVLVDDDADDQHLVELLLKQLNIPNPLHCLTNGLEAIQYLETTEEQPFIILSDVNMPVMDGIEFRRRIQASEYLRRKAIPFIYLTTAADRPMVQAAYDATVQGFFIKSTSYSGLKQQLQCIIEYWKSCLHPNSWL